MAQRTVLRRILSEIRMNLNQSPGESVARLRGLPLANHILGQFRRNQVTEKQICKQDRELSNLADNYANYLTSQRLWLNVHQEYHSKSERSVTDTARIVGFKLPHDPK